MKNKDKRFWQFNESQMAFESLKQDYNKLEKAKKELDDQVKDSKSQETPLFLNDFKVDGQLQRRYA